MARQHHLCTQFPGTLQRGVKVLHFKPQQDSISMRQSRISDPPMMMFNVPIVQLEDQLIIGNQLFIMASSMAALAAQQTLVPETARFDIPNRD